MENLVSDIWKAMQDVRSSHVGRAPTRIRMTPGVFEELKQIAKYDAEVIGPSALYGVPVIVDDDLAVRWRVEYDGPGRFA